MVVCGGNVFAAVRPQLLYESGSIGVPRTVVAKDDKGKRLVFLTNNFTLKPELIADLYRQRWQVELFFKRNVSMTLLHLAS